MWLGANMQFESSSCITGVCVLFVYLVFTKGTHHITEVTTVCFKRAGAGALFQEGKGDVANLLCLVLVAVDFFFFKFLFGWQICFLKPFRTLLLLKVGSFALIFFGISVCLFACQAVLAAGGSEGSAPQPCRAASACLQHNWSQGQQSEGFCPLWQSLGGESWHWWGSADTEKGAPTKEMAFAVVTSGGPTELLRCLAALPPWMGLANWRVGIIPLILWAAKRLCMCTVSDFIGGRIPNSQRSSDCAELTPYSNGNIILLIQSQRGLIFQDQLKQFLAPAGKWKPSWEGRGE